MNTFVSTARSSFHPLPQKGCLYTQVLGWLAMRMDKRMEAQAKMIAAMGLNAETARRLIQ
jgi:hypothetical protein